MKRLLLTSALLLVSLPARAASIEEVKRYGESYLGDLPNFLCYYDEINYKRNYNVEGGWKRKKWHTGEIRYNRADTRWNRRVLTFKGKSTKKKLHKISSYLGNFGSGVDYSGWEIKKRKWSSRKAEDGTELEIFEVSSESGITLHRGLNKHRNLKKARSAPAWGEVWAEKDTGRIRKVILAYSSDGSRYGSGVGKQTYEYAYFDLDGKSYLLPDKISNGGEYDLLVVKHYGYRRFQAKSTILTATSRIKFDGPETAAASPPPPRENPPVKVVEPAKKETVVRTPRKAKPPRPKKTRKKKQGGTNYLALARGQKKEKPFINHMALDREAGKPLIDYLSLDPRGYTPPYSKPKPDPPKKVTASYVIPFGAIFSLFLIAGLIGAGVYFIRIR